MLTLHLTRDVFGSTFTLGMLAIDEHDGRGPRLFGYTCEDYDDFTDSPVYAKQDWGRLCIPAGDYPVLWTWSPKYQRHVPLVAEVPGRKGIRIHSGNGAKDTEGCPLVGILRDTVAGTITKSRIAARWLEPRIEAAQTAGGCRIQITRAAGAVRAVRP